MATCSISYNSLLQQIHNPSIHFSHMAHSTLSIVLNTKQNIFIVQLSVKLNLNGSHGYICYCLSKILCGVLEYMELTITVGLDKVYYFIGFFFHNLLLFINMVKADISLLNKEWKKEWYWVTNKFRSNKKSRTRWIFVSWPIFTWIT